MKLNGDWFIVTLIALQLLGAIIYWYNRSWNKGLFWFFVGLANIAVLRMK